MASRLETNFVRLLNRCEAMAAANNENDWRLEKFVGALKEQLLDLKKSSSKPGPEMLTEYTRRVEFLQGLLEAEKMPTASDKAMAAEFIVPTPSSASTSSAQTRGLHLQRKAHYQKDMREELLGKDADSGLRQRKEVSTEEDIDQVMRHHNQLQEQIAEEMVHLARSMKDTAQRAGKLVRDDTKKIEASGRLADSNQAKLKIESARLEAHVQKSCNWTLWVALAFVCIIFIAMVVFMRVFTKPR